MKRLVEFLKTTVLGGALIVLPVWLAVLLLLKAVMQLQVFVKPVTAALPSEMGRPVTMATRVRSQTPAWPACVAVSRYAAFPFPARS